MTIQDRFNELETAIIESADLNILDPDIRREMELFGQQMKARILRDSPDGSKWEDPIEDVFQKRRIFANKRSPRPSIRQHGMTFKEGIQDPIITARSGVRNKTHGLYEVEIPSTAPHAQVVLDGRRNAKSQKAVNAKTLFYFDFKKRQVTNTQKVNTGTTPANNFIRDIIFDFGRSVDNRFINLLSKSAMKPLKDLFGKK